MFAYLHRILPCYYALLSILLGLSLAWAFSNITALYLDSGIDVTQTLKPQKNAPNTLPPDNKVILQRNIFNSADVPSTETPSTPNTSTSAVEPTQSGDALSDTELAGRNVKEAKSMQLVGTIAGGPEAIAVINSDGEIGVYRVGDPIATSARVVKIERLRVYVENSDASISILELDEQFAPNSTATSTSSTEGSSTSASGSDGVQQVNDTSWRISSERAEQIRTNIASVVRQARVEPVVAQGQTQGFVVKYIQPGTLLTEMGLKRGDVIKQVNGIALDSPEKGLQVFQQLRESKSMDLSIERNNTPMTFKYEIR
ncbi:MAG: type II secretion system protein GspC [Desulfuromonadaceae bacterium]